MKISRLEKNIVQGNPLIEARKHMNVTEMRLFGLGLSDIHPHIKDDTVYDVDFHDTWITYGELQELFNSDHNGNISNLKKKIDKAFQAFIEIPNSEGGFKLRHIYEEMEYFPQKGLLIRFHDKLKPFVLDLVGKAYTVYKLKLLFLLSSEYSQRIIELLLKQQGFFKKGSKEVFYEVTIEELRRELNITDELYAGRMDNFRSRVLDLPIKEINDKTDYFVWYDIIKKGRRITGVRLWMRVKEKDVLAAPEENPKKKIDLETGQKKPEPQNEEEMEHLGRLGKYEIAPQTGRMLIKKYGWERIDANLKYAYEHRQRKENMSGWIIDCIKNDRAAGAAEAKRLAKKAADKKQKELMARLEPLPFEIEPPRELPADSPFKRFERKPHAKRAVSKK